MAKNLGWVNDDRVSKVVGELMSNGVVFKEVSHEPHGYDTVYESTDGEYLYHVCSD